MRSAVQNGKQVWAVSSPDSAHACIFLNVGSRWPDAVPGQTAKAARCIGNVLRGNAIRVLRCQREMRSRRNESPGHIGCAPEITFLWTEGIHGNVRAGKSLVRNWCENRW